MPAPRLVDISQDLGLSVSAISMALDGHPRIGAVTRDRVQNYCLEIGYISKEKLVSRLQQRRRKQRVKTTSRIGYVVVGANEHTDDTYVISLANEMRAAGNLFEVLPLGDMTSDALVDACEQAAQNLDVMVLTGRVSVKTANAVQSRVGKCVVLGNAYQEQDRPHTPLACPRVAPDITELGRLSVGYLLRRGHRRVGLYAFAAPTDSYNDQWRLGGRQALLQAGLPMAPELEHFVTLDEATPESVADYFMSLDEPPTAIAAPSDWVAQPFIHAMQERGSTITMDDVVIGGLRRMNQMRGLGNLPQVTQDVEQVCRVLAHVVAALIRDDMPAPVSLTVPGRCWNFTES